MLSFFIVLKFIILLTLQSTNCAINAGTFTGTNANLPAKTVGLTIQPTANVTNLTVTLSESVGGLSGKLLAGAALTARSPDANISAPGEFTINPFATYAASSDLSLNDATVRRSYPMIAFHLELEHIPLMFYDYFRSYEIPETIVFEEIGEDA